MSRLALAALFIACGCGTDSAPSADADSPPRITLQEALLESAHDEAAVGDTVGIGGLDPAVPLRKWTFEDVPLPFSTYAYEDWTARVDSSAETTSVWFSTGEPGPELVAVQLIMSPEFQAERWTADQLHEFARNEMGSEARDLEGLPEWALAGAVGGDAIHIEVVRIAEHDGLYLDIKQAFPRGSGTRYLPAADTLLSRLRWLDDGTGL